MCPLDGIAASDHFSLPQDSTREHPSAFKARFPTLIYDLAKSLYEQGGLWLGAVQTFAVTVGGMSDLLWIVTASLLALTTL